MVQDDEAACHDQRVLGARKARALLGVAMCVVVAESALDAAILQAKTAQEFDRYAAAVEARLTREAENGGPFLGVEQQSMQEVAKARAALRRGQVVVARGAATDANRRAIKVAGGVINHWRGTVLVPNVTLDALLDTLQEPQSDRHKQEDVLASRVVERDGDSMKVYLRLRRTKFVTVVYDTYYDVRYRRTAPDRATCTSLSTRIVEIEGAGTPRERIVPDGEDHGYLWRLHTYWRYQQFEGGVLVELESLTLSRETPFLLGPLVRPIVTHIARESMNRTLESLRARFTA